MSKQWKTALSALAAVSLLTFGSAPGAAAPDDQTTEKKTKTPPTAEPAGEARGTSSDGGARSTESPTTPEEVETSASEEATAGQLTPEQMAEARDPERSSDDPIGNEARALFHRIPRVETKDPALATHRWLAQPARGPWTDDKDPTKTKRLERATGESEKNQWYMPAPEGEMSEAAREGMTAVGVKAGEPVSPTVRARTGYDATWFEKDFLREAWSANHLVIEASNMVLDWKLPEETRELAKTRAQAHMEMQDQLVDAATRSALNVPGTLTEDHQRLLGALRKATAGDKVGTYRDLLSKVREANLPLYERCAAECETQNMRRIAEAALGEVKAHETPADPEASGGKS
jgi:predicted outer membrane protein